MYSSGFCGVRDLYFRRIFFPGSAGGLSTVLVLLLTGAMLFSAVGCSDNSDNGEKIQAVEEQAFYG